MSDLLPYALLKIEIPGLYDEPQWFGILKDFEVLEQSEKQKTVGTQIIQHISSDLPQYRFKKMAIVWNIDTETGTLFIGEQPDNEVQFDFKVIYKSSER